MAIRTYISIIILNVNGLNAPTQRHRLAECIQKQNMYKCCLQRTYFSSWGHRQTENGGMGKGILCKWKKKARAAIPIDKIDCYERKKDNT